LSLTFAQFGIISPVFLGSAMCILYSHLGYLLCSRVYRHFVLIAHQQYDDTVMINPSVGLSNACLNEWTVVTFFDYLAGASF